MVKSIIRITGYLLLLSIIVLLIVIKSMNFRWSDHKFERKFVKKGIHFRIQYVEQNGKNIRYIETGNKAKSTIIFLHGSPGSSKDYEAYLQDKELNQKFLMKAIDRPGYGFSDLGDSELSIKKQAELINNIVPDNSIIVGHSLGGPVAAALAMYYPEKVSRLILLAPAVDPNHEKQFINHIIGKPPLKYLFSKAIQVTFEEKLAHEEALMEIMYDWQSINCAVTVAHGTSDWIVPYENVAFLKNKLTHAVITFVTNEDMSHIMIWDDFELVKQIIMERE